MTQSNETVAGAKHDGAPGSAAEKHADVLGSHLRDIQPRVFDCLCRRADCELRESCEAPGLFPVDVDRGVELLDFAANPAWKLVGIEQREWSDARSACLECAVCYGKRSVKDVG